MHTFTKSDQSPYFNEIEKRKRERGITTVVGEKGLTTFHPGHRKSSICTTVEGPFRSTTFALP